MNKKIITIIAVSLAVLLIGAAIVFAIQNRNDPAKNDAAMKDNSNKESMSSEIEDAELNDPEHETEKTPTETTETETKPSVKDPEETEAPSKEPEETEPEEPEPTEPEPTEPEPTEPEPTEPEPTEPEPTEPEPTEPESTEPESTEPERTEPIAPNFTIYDGNGNKVHLSDYAGKPIILNFWASWCTPCKKEMPDFNKKYLQYGDQIQFLMIDFAKDDKIEDAKAYVSEMGFAFPIYFDTYGDATYTYGVNAFPTTVFIDADGYIVARYRGTISEGTLQSGIDMILE